jgi:hypothetical protein
MLYVYYFLMCTAFVVSIFHLKDNRVKWISLLLGISMITELVVEILKTQNQSYNFIYHIFIPLEYACIAGLMRQMTDRKRIQVIITYSVIPFFLISALISIFFVPWNKFPSVHGSIEAVPLVFYSLIVLMQIKPVEDLPIHQLAVFWFSLAFLVYFIGTTTFNGVYNSLLAAERKNARQLFDLINSLANYFLYTFIVLGIICTKWEPKYSAPL